MADIVPPNLVERLEFYEAHLAIWAANAVAIGTTSAKITSLTTLVTDTRAKLTAQEVAKDAARSATGALHDADDAMSLAGGNIVKEIKTKAAATPGNSVWNLSNLPIPSTPGPVGAPGTATDFTVTLLPANGSLMMDWTCVNPANAVGVWYEVERALGASTEFSFVGTSGRREFVDSTVPAGTSRVTYRITAARTTGKGAPATFLVQFGTGGTGEMTASVVVAPRIAA